MNPEEGELRPQLLDRFGLTVEVAGLARRRHARRGRAPPARVRRRPGRLRRGVGRRRGGRRRARIAAARARLPRWCCPTPSCAGSPRSAPRSTSTACAPTSSSPAPRSRTRPGAGADEVTEEDVRVAARLALPHRRRRDPFDAPGLDEQTARGGAATARTRNRSRTGRTRRAGSRRRTAETVRSRRSGRTARTVRHRTVRDSTGAAAGAGRPSSETGPTQARPAGDGATQAAPPPRRRSAPGGSRCPARARARRAAGPGPAPTAAGSSAPTHGTPRRAAELHLPATVRAAAPHQRARGRTGAGCCCDRGDLRHAEREGREGNLVLFVVDASGSMAARKRMAAVKGAVLSLLRDAYQRRDKVGLVTFRGDRRRAGAAADVRVPTAAARLAGLRTGGRTPLAAGLLRAREVLRWSGCATRAAARCWSWSPTAGPPAARPGTTPSPTPAARPGCWPRTGSRPSSSTARRARSGSAWPAGLAAAAGAAAGRARRAVRRPRRRRGARRPAPR